MRRNTGLQPWPTPTQAKILQRLMDKKYQVGSKLISASMPGSTRNSIKVAMNRMESLGFVKRGRILTVKKKRYKNKHVIPTGYHHQIWLLTPLGRKLITFLEANKLLPKWRLKLSLISLQFFI